MSEEWRPVPGFEGIYEVSSEGRVKSLARVVTHSYSGSKTFPEKIRRPFVRATGHLGIDLYKGNRRTHATVHRLVAFAFIGPGGPGLEVCHNDGNPANNNVDNLRWDTSKANSADMRRHGTNWHASKTHCEQGHEFNEENTYYRPSKPNNRVCRACLLAAHKRYRVRLRAEGKRAS